MQMFTKIAALVATTLCSTLALANAAQATVVSDGGFETQGAATNGNCHFSSNCPAGAWSGNSSAGINLKNSGSFEGNTPDGNYYAFLQSLNGSTGTIIQSVTLDAGSYLVSWLAGGRNNFGGSPSYTVSLGGQIYSGALATAQPFTATSALVTLAAGTYDLNFSAHTVSGDNSALIDQVSIAAVPEPATWAMMIGGLGVIGATMRWTRKVNTRA